MQCLRVQGVEEKLAFPKNEALIEELAQRKSRLLSIQNGSRRGMGASKAVVLHEGSLRALWTERADRSLEVKQVCSNLSLECCSGRGHLQAMPMTLHDKAAIAAQHTIRASTEGCLQSCTWSISRTATTLLHLWTDPSDQKCIPCF